MGSKVHFISLGCARNRVDTEVMIGVLTQQGWLVVDSPEEADAVVINTCGFIGPAKEESIQTILEIAALKENKELRLVVAGCLTQRYQGQLASELPEVDLFIGTDEFPRIAQYLADPAARGVVHAARSHYLFSGELPRVNTLATGSAYLKVAEGCSHACAFCIIPAIRGKLRSRPIESIMGEARTLADQGVVELNLIAQDLAGYGREAGGQGRLVELLRELVTIDAIRWVRLLYVYPENIDERFLEFFAAEPKIVKYLDIPVQHASDAMLGAMRRNITRDALERVIARVREAAPAVALRTSVMVGFPGETEDDFQQLKDFVARQRFTHLGCFTFSAEEGTAAYAMEPKIPAAVMKKRQNSIMKLQRGISREHMQAMVGQQADVLIKGVSEESDLLGEGRLAMQAPEVDGVVYINDGELRPGTMQRVAITEAHDYDLVGHIVCC